MAAGRAFRVTRTTHDGHAKPNTDMFTVERYCLNFQRESSGDDWEPMSFVRRANHLDVDADRPADERRPSAHFHLTLEADHASCSTRKRRLSKTTRVKENHHVNTSFGIGRRRHGRVRSCGEYRSRGPGLRSERLARYLGPLPLRAAGLCRAASGDLCSAAGLDLRLPSRLLAGPVGPLPRHAISRPPAERRMAMSGRKPDPSPAMGPTADRSRSAACADLIHRKCSQPCGQVLAKRDN